MFIFTAVLSALLAATMAQSALRKANPGQDSIELRDRLRVSPALWSAVGIPEALAAAGLLIGLWWAPLGVAAAVGVVLVMVGAVALHVRVGFLGAALVPPVAIALVAVAVSGLRVTTA